MKRAKSSIFLKEVGSVSFLFLLLFSVFNPLSNNTFGETRLIRGNTSAEFESIDSFDVHPASGRWDVTNSGFTATCTDSLFTMSDTGDESVDSYEMTRKIRDMEGIIEIRWKYDAQAIMGSADIVSFDLRSPLASQFIKLYFNEWNNNGNPAVGRIYFYGTDDQATYISLTAAELESINDNVWHILKIDYNIPKSLLRMRLVTDSRVTLFDYNEVDIFEGATSTFGGFHSLEVGIAATSFESQASRDLILDYVLAPFDERNWEHTTVGSSINWMTQATWEFTRARDNIDEVQTWQLNVQNLDRASGVLVIHPEDRTALLVGDTAKIFFYLYSIDGDDGDLHEAIQIILTYYSPAPASYISSCDVYVDGVLTHASPFKTATDDIAAVQFIFGVKEDRSVIVYEILFKWDVTDETQSILYTGDVAASDVATDPSQEFALAISYEMNFDANTEITSFVDDWEIVSNWFWAALAIIGIGFGILTILTMTLGASGSGGIFQPIFDIWDGILKGISDIFGPFVSAFTEWADSVIGDFFKWLFSLVGDVINWFIELVFWAWELGNLPDLLAWLQWGLTGLSLGASGGLVWLQSFLLQLQSVWDLGSILGIVFFFLLPLLAAPTIGLYLEKMFSAMAFDLTFGFSPLNLIPRIPAVAVWLVVLQFNILDGTAFGGFLTW